MTTRIDKPDTEADKDLRQCIDEMQSFVMIAGAGSGKTTSLIKGLDYIRKNHGSKLSAQRQKIACVTYTTNAVDEITRDVGDDQLFHVSTIHSFLWDIIKPFQKDIKEWVTRRLRERIAILQEKIQNYGPRVQQKTKDKDGGDLQRLEELKGLVLTVTNFHYETGSNYAEGILGHADILRMVPELIESKVLLKKILIQKFPFVFIDESQDTAPNVVNCFISVDSEKKNNFCLGFFGDPMQKIYVTGIGKINAQENWKEIIKEENFRCPQRILQVINAIRKPADQIEQLGGKIIELEGKRVSVAGSARLFVLTADTNRAEKLQKVRAFIAVLENDLMWQEDKNSDLKILVIEHRMAAKRLNFEELHSIFKDKTTDSISNAFSEGKSWALSIFQKFILPLIASYVNGNHPRMMELLRAYSPILQKGYLLQNKIKGNDLTSFKVAIETLAKAISDPKVSVRDILHLVEDKKLAILDDRITAQLKQQALTIENSEIISQVLEKYFACPVTQIVGYDKYINEESVYSTQHDVKGSEFERVIVVLDDEEGVKSTLFSYEKLLGIKDLSDTDNENLQEGKETVLDRTRRLFYVCCSRAQKDLAVILFVQDVEEVLNALDNSVFEKDSIFTEGSLN